MNRKVATGLFALIIIAVPVAGQALPVLGLPHNEVHAVASGWFGDTDAGSCDGPTVASDLLVSTRCEVVRISPTAPLQASASASAGSGAVHIYTRAAGKSVGVDELHSAAAASAVMIDHIAVSGPANATGHLYGSLVISGLLSAVDDGWPALAAAQSAYFVGTSFGSFSGDVLTMTDSTWDEMNRQGGVLPVDIELSFDADGWALVTLEIAAQLSSSGGSWSYRECDACTLFEGSFDTEADLLGSIYWGGITGVTANGAPLTDFDLISASGVDYRYATAIPESSTALLVLAGLAVLRARGSLRGKAL